MGISGATVREIAGTRGRAAPITSVYLDVDGRRLPRTADVEAELDRVLRPLRAVALADASVAEDLRRIETLVRAGLDRSDMRGLAVFACSADGWWHVVPLPMPVSSHAQVGAAPAVGQLEALLQEHDPMGVVLVDRNRVRLLVVHLGEVVESEELVDEAPRAIDVRGERERGTPRSHLDELAHQHLRRAADAAFALWKAHGFPHLVLGGAEPVVAELERLLHPYLHERLRGRLAVSAHAETAEVVAAATAFDLSIEHEREDALVERLRAAVGSRRRGVAGLEATLNALNEHRVERLLVSRGFQEEGWRCPTSGTLCASGPTSPVTGSPMERVGDVVEGAVEVALAQGLPVAMVEGNADLDVMGRIGALLRY